MTTVIQEKTTKNNPLQTVQPEKKQHLFIITVEINADRSRQFIDSLGYFDAMKQAALSAIPEGVRIRLKASDEGMSQLILKGIHQHCDVKKVAFSVC